MKFGIIVLVCHICGNKIEYDQSKPTKTMLHNLFGIICSKLCHDAAELKYVRMILGKDESLGS